MVQKITGEQLGKVKNDALRKDIEFYIDIYDQFLNEIKNTGMEISTEDDSAEVTKLAEELKSLGVKVRNNGKSFLWGNISPSCEDCVTGEGSATFIVSLKCNRDCFFCTNKNQYDYAHHNDRVNDIITQYNTTSKRYEEMRSAAITGGEPLLFVDECIKFIKHAKKRHKNVKTRIYTNGDLATEETLKRLAEAGLDEIRFGLKPDKEGKVAEALFRNMENAVSYIPRVMVEMPAEPGTLEQMKTLFDRLEAIGVYSINILEFLFPWVHVKEYKEAGFKVRQEPYKVLYDYDYAGGVSVAGSELECLELVKYAAQKNFKMGVHYCSLENKLTAQVWHHNRKFKKTPLEYFSENDFFVKTAKAYGTDADKVKETLDKNSAGHYTYNKSNGFIEFPVTDIPLLKGLNTELGISVMILDYDEERTFVREIAVHLTDTESFSLKDI